LDGFRGARLGWDEADWSAVLETDGTVGVEDLITALARRQAGCPGRLELAWSSNIKTARTQYLQAAAAALEAAHAGRRGFADFLSAFACELRTNDQDQVEPTAFYMTSGQQKFLKEVGHLAQRLATGIQLGRHRKSTEDLFREALLGPWLYQDPQHSLGWDPTAERLHALRAQSPTKEASAGVAAAVWLAFEALPLFPCFLSEMVLATTGFVTHGTNWRDSVTHLTWPLWTCPAPVDTLRSLLSLPDLAAEKPHLHELRQRGIVAVFRSERYKVRTQGNYFILRPAYPSPAASG
jgi:hypothetical protein